MNRTNRAVGWVAAMVVNASLAFTARAFPTSQTTAFTWQGVLKQSGSPVNGSVDLQFRLFDAAVAGTPIGSTLALNAVNVSNGLFSASLDFGALAFDGNERWLEIAVRSPAGSMNPFVTLAPRQKLASAPYAAFALQTALSGTYASAVNLSNAGNTLAGSGAAVTALNASNIATGNLNVARMPASGAWSLGGDLNINNSSLFLQQTSGEVGIGTSNPGATLEVARSAAGNINPTLLLRQTGSGSTSAIRFQNVSNNHFNLGMTAANEFALGYNANVPLAGDLLRITSTGNLGLGTIAPSARLHVMDGSAGAVTASSSALVLERSASNFLSMFAPDGFQSGVRFGQPTAGNAAGSIVFNTPFTPAGLTLSTASTSRMVIDSAGNVGVNTNAPLAMLNVYEPDETPNLNAVRTTVNNAGVLISADYTDGAYAAGVFWNTLNDNPDKPKAGIYLKTDAVGSSMHLRTSTNYASGLDSAGLSLDAEGNVAVGSPSLAPVAALGVYGGNFDTPVLDIQGADSADVHIGAGNRGGGLNAGDVTIEAGQGFTLTHGGKVFITAGNADNNAAGGIFIKAGDSLQRGGGDIELTAGTHSSGSYANIIMTGDVGIGRTPVNNVLEVEGAASKSAAGNWAANSDAHIKTDVRTIDGESALDALDRVRLVSFRYTPDYLKAHSTIEDRRYLNVIAQEFALVFPDHVKGSGEYLTDGHEILQVDTYPLTIYSAAAVQELNANVKRLENENQSLRNEVAELRRLVTQVLSQEK